MSGDDRESKTLSTQDASTLASDGGLRTQPMAAPTLATAEEEVPPGTGRIDPLRYQVRGIYAKGGQARILLAFDRHLQREIAIKEMLPEVECEAESRQPSSQPRSTSVTTRFLREARVTGQLEHPNIVPVYELGRRDDGTLCYTMRLLRGTTMAQRLKECRTLRERLKLLGAFRDTCNAIAFAHSRGVVHRDIKPQNVMLGEFGETVVLDWGVAKVRGQRDLRAREIEDTIQKMRRPPSEVETVDGAIIGTPSYMSPEQARGEVDQIDERSDVWGLGAMLYVILTGRPPFRGKSEDETLRLVAEAKLVPVLELCPDAPAELAAVAEKALQREPDRRYQSARELAEEVEAYLTGGKVRSYAYTSWELLRRFVARNRAAVVAAGVVLAAILASLVAVSISYRREIDSRQREEAARQEEHRQRLRAHFHLAQALAQQAGRMLQEYKLLSARVYAAASLLNNPANPAGPFFDDGYQGEQSGGEALRVEAFSIAYAAGFGPIRGLRHVWQLEDQPLRLAFSPDSHRLAAVDHHGRLTVFGLPEGIELLRLEAHRDRPLALAFFPDGRILTASREGVLKIWKLPDAGPERVIERPMEGPQAVALSGDGRLLAVGLADGRVRLEEAEDGNLLRMLERGTKKILDLSFSADGRLLAGGFGDGTATLWNTATGRRLAVLRGHTEGVFRVAFDRRATILITSSFDNTTRIWETSSGRQLRILTEQATYQIAFHPDGRRVATIDLSPIIWLFDVASAKTILAVEAHEQGVSWTAFSPDGKWLASAGQDRRLRLWEMEPGESPPRWILAQEVLSSRVFADGMRLATGDEKGKIQIWRVDSGTSQRALLSQDGVKALAVSADGKRLAACEYGNSVRVWEVESGRQIWNRHNRDGELFYLDFSPDGALLAAARKDKAVWLLDAGTGKDLGTLTSAEGAVLRLAFSPDGRRLAAAGVDRKIRLYDVPSRSLLATLTGHDDWILALCFSPDGSLLASSGRDQQVLLWDVGSGRLIRRLGGQKQWLVRLAFSRQGRLLASAGDAGEDSQVFLWETRDGRLRLRFPIGFSAEDVAFSPDDSKLLLVGSSSIVSLPLALDEQQADPARLLAEAESAAGARLDGFELRFTSSR